MSRSNDLLRTFEDLRDQTVPTSHESAGLVLSSNLTSSLDRALVSLVSEAESREGQYPLAVFTHGSTGRGEQTRFSDIDLMIIVGEGQHLAIGPNFGGPGLGIFGIRYNSKKKNGKPLSR